LPWWRIPLYPIAFLDALVLLTWANAGLHLDLVVRPLLVATAVVLVIEFCLAGLLLDRDRAGMIATVIVLGFISTDDRVAILLVLSGLLVVVEGLVHRGRPAIVAGIATRLLTFVAIVLSLLVIVDFVQHGTWTTVAAELTARSPQALGPAPSDHPDVFIVLLDGYPGDRAASRATAFDADAFPRSLEARGFDVVRDAHSNYLSTPLTLASMFSMRHLVDLEALSPPHPSHLSDFRQIGAVLGSAPALALARDAGYAVTVIDSGFAHLRLGHADQRIEQPGPQELELYLMGSTRVGKTVDALLPGTRASFARARIEGILRAAAELEPQRSGPRLIFVHVPAPHPPWVFAADGAPREPTSLSFGGEPKLSTQEALDIGFDQANHVADLATATIDRILGASPSRPVIVVMSDHGPSNEALSDDGGGADLEVRASSFMAALTPGYPGLFTSARPTPVNLLSLIFDTYLGIHIERQPDSLWRQQGPSYLDLVEAPPIAGWTK
jgi:hypothetical protein